MTNSCLLFSTLATFAVKIPICYFFQFIINKCKYVSSNDNKENDCNGEVDGLEKNSRKKI